MFQLCVSQWPGFDISSASKKHTSPFIPLYVCKKPSTAQYSTASTGVRLSYLTTCLGSLNLDFKISQWQVIKLIRDVFIWKSILTGNVYLQCWGTTPALPWPWGAEGRTGTVWLGTTGHWRDTGDTPEDRTDRRDYQHQRYNRKSMYSVWESSQLIVSCTYLVQPVSETEYTSHVTCNLPQTCIHPPA